MSKKKVLILGSNGFLGRHTLSCLSNNEQFDIVDIRDSSELDIRNYEELNSYLKKNRPDHIINCAAFVGGISYGYKYQAKLLEHNVKLGINIYQASLENKILSVINPISNCVYPENISLYKEEDLWNGPPHESVYFYAQSKRFLIALAQGYKKEHGLNSVNVIMSNMYGPFDHFDPDRSHALGALLKKIYDAKVQKENKVEIYGTGKPLREWLYVEDAAISLVKSLDLESDYYLFNVGVNEGISVLDLAKKIAKKVNWEGEFTFDLSRPDGVRAKTVDGTYGKKILGWEPQIDLDTGIAKTVEWYMEENG